MSKIRYTLSMLILVLFFAAFSYLVGVSIAIADDCSRSPSNDLFRNIQQTKKQVETILKKVKKNEDKKEIKLILK